MEPLLPMLSLALGFGIVLGIVHTYDRRPGSRMKPVAGISANIMITHPNGQFEKEAHVVFYENRRGEREIKATHVLFETRPEIVHWLAGGPLPTSATSFTDT